MKKRETLFVHCGLHKTATTTIQAQLGKHREQLATMGLYVPLAGGLSPGNHHNIAFELQRLPRFRLKFGDMCALRQELQHISGDIILSSEEFQIVLGTDGGLKPLKELAAAIGRELTLIVFLREQSSLFVSTMGQILGDFLKPPDVEDQAESVFLFGDLINGRRVLHFDFSRMLDRVKRQGVECILKDYSGISSFPLNDILEATGRDVLDFDENKTVFLNRGGAQPSLSKFIRTRLNILDPSATASVASIDSKLPVTSGISPELIDRFKSAFEASNSKLLSETGLDMTRGSATPAGGGECAMDKVFTLRSQMLAEPIVQRYFPEFDMVRSRANGWRRSYSGLLNGNKKAIHACSAELLQVLGAEFQNPV